jgi:hypothetical protein
MTVTRLMHIAEAMQLKSKWRNKGIQAAGA